MEAKDLWCYFWGARNFRLVVFPENRLNRQG